VKKRDDDGACQTAQESSTCDGIVTWFVAGGLRGVKEGEGT